MLRRLLVFGLLCALLVSASAAAAVTSIFTYSLSTSDAALDFYFDATLVPCEPLSFNSDFPVYYRVVQFYVTVSGAYDFEDRHNDDLSLSDGDIAIFSGGFNPDAPGVGCLGQWDDNDGFGTPVNLVANTVYTMVQSADDEDETGNFAYTVMGPGELIFGTPSGDDSGPVIGPPCDNLFDGRINDDQSLDCAAPVAIYLVDGRVDVYAVDPNTGRGTLVISTSGAADDAAVESSGNILLGTSGNIRLYWLPATSEYLLQATYADGKPYEVVWSGDGSNLRHTTA